MAVSEPDELFHFTGYGSNAQKMAIVKVLLDIISVDEIIDARETRFFEEIINKFDLRAEDRFKVRGYNTLNCLAVIKAMTPYQKDVCRDLMVSTILTDGGIDEDEQIAYDNICEFCNIPSKSLKANNVLTEYPASMAHKFVLKRFEVEDLYPKATRGIIRNVAVPPQDFELEDPEKSEYAETYPHKYRLILFGWKNEKGEAQQVTLWATERNNYPLTNEERIDLSDITLVMEQNPETKKWASKKPTFIY